MIRRVMFFLSILIPSYGYSSDPVKINITGRVIAAPCIVDLPDGNTVHVDLGMDISVSDLNSPDSHSTWVPFVIKLRDCPPGTRNSTMALSGVPDPDDNQRYKNTGDAENITVELQSENDGKILQNGTIWTLPVNTDRGIVWNMRTRAYSSSGMVKPGTISSVITATFTYQ